eukprot:CAMPEP_0174345334 /NCGR_PEP_ID=MMETSP0811_2-20130205/775_1 /TAXON_ID=73025 ORGANISM="Eutreptiella gymnastica-like, Strain CCMP1594" /NCGR_SAMPLE_ID=MMETSP0811_2 /ASSEMBLY_ACC=CAM_ASM_000667 /LENGTH=177 /DNA_ID=CAMNT_0015468961 /DNA_START=694 /DNA_END=1225 /DNA_ORIENTATION=-
MTRGEGELILIPGNVAGTATPVGIPVCYWSTRSTARREKQRSVMPRESNTKEEVNTEVEKVTVRHGHSRPPGALAPRWEFKEHHHVEEQAITTEESKGSLYRFLFWSRSAGGAPRVVLEEASGIRAVRYHGGLFPHNKRKSRKPLHGEQPALAGGQASSGSRIRPTQYADNTMIANT